jgi:uncharacterized protein YkwD
MSKVFQTLLIYLLLLAGIFPATATANGLFADPEKSQQVNLPPVDPDIVKRQRLVSIRFEELSGGNAQTLLLDLFEDVNLIAVRHKLERNTPKVYSWTGYIADIANSDATIVVDNHKMAATIVLSQFSYKVRHIQNDLHVIREISRLSLQTAIPLPNNLALGLSAAEPSSIENEVALLVNQERAEAGLYPLNPDNSLFIAAQDHSADMAQQNYFSHNSLDGRLFSQRISNAGYTWNACGENIAAGYSTAQSVVNAWMNSSGHRANILSSLYCDLGVGYAFNTNSDYKYYWTQDFGRKQGISSCITENLLPVAHFTANPLSGEKPLLVSFDASESTDPDGAIVSYMWDFGDGAAGSGKFASHRYTTEGIYTVTLTVTDNDGAFNSHIESDFITVIFAEDSDDDGMPDHEEYGPNKNDPSYDGNGDGLPDAEQNHVASGHTFNAKYYVTLTVSDPASLKDCKSVASPSDDNTPTDISFTYGFFEFIIAGLDPGDSATVTLYLSKEELPDTYYKYGATPNNPSDHWYKFLFDSQTGAQINGHIITLHFIDGQRGDDDLDNTNGSIIDIGGPGVSNSITTSETTAFDTNTSSGGGGCFISTLAGQP